MRQVQPLVKAAINASGVISMNNRRWKMHRWQGWSASPSVIKMLASASAALALAISSHSR